MKNRFAQIVSASFFGVTLVAATLGFAAKEAEKRYATAGGNTSVVLSTTYDQPSRMYLTRGVLEPKVPILVLSEILARPDKFDEWILTDINKDYKTKGFLVLIKSFRFSPKDKRLTTVFDLNLPWPFDYKNMTLDLLEGEKTYDANGQLRGSTYKLEKTSLALNRFNLNFTVNEVDGFAQLACNFEVEISYLIAPFFSREKYLTNVQDRIGQALLNLQNYAKARAPAPF